MAQLDQATIEKVKNGQLTFAKAIGMNEDHYAALLLAGHTLFQQGQLEDARKLFEALSMLHAKNPYVHGILGAIYQKEGRLDAAVLRYSVALSLYPQDVNSLTNRGEIYLQTGKFKEAAEDLKKAIELDPERKNPAANRARLLVALTVEALKMAKEEGVGAVYDAKKRIDEQLASA